jgi:hypothetical protein
MSASNPPEEPDEKLRCVKRGGRCSVDRTIPRASVYGRLVLWDAFRENLWIASVWERAKPRSRQIVTLGGRPAPGVARPLVWYVLRNSGESTFEAARGDHGEPVGARDEPLPVAA